MFALLLLGLLALTGTAVVTARIPHAGDELGTVKVSIKEKKFSHGYAAYLTHQYPGSVFMVMDMTAYDPTLDRYKLRLGDEVTLYVRKTDADALIHKLAPPIVVAAGLVAANGEVFLEPKQVTATYDMLVRSATLIAIGLTVVPSLYFIAVITLFVRRRRRAGQRA
ncbi:MAG: hypothetical protein AB7H77_03205 [Bdellovibrionales bacterium]